MEGRGRALGRGSKEEQKTSRGERVNEPLSQSSFVILRVERDSDAKGTATVRSALGMTGIMISPSIVVICAHIAGARPSDSNPLSL